MSLTSSDIRDKILARQSFWVGTQSERVIASAFAKATGVKYTTGKDDRGGFYITHIRKVRKPVSA